MKVYLVIDDYTPDAGSTIYGVFRTRKKADQYLEEGMADEYGEDYAAESDATVEEFEVY